MTTMKTNLSTLLLSLGVLAAGATFAPAAEIALRWAPSADDVTAGYEVEVLDADGNVDDRIDAGNKTQLVVNGLTDGTVYRFRVRPYDTWGHKAARPSAEIATLPAPRVDAVEDWSIKGDTARCTLVGVNFDKGAHVAPALPGVKVTLVKVIDTTRLTVELKGATRAPIASDMLVVNPVRHADEFVKKHAQLLDVDRNGTVDRQDATRIQAAFGATRGTRNYHPDLDVNGDGVIDGEDLSIVRAALKKS